MDSKKLHFHWQVTITTAKGTALKQETIFGGKVEITEQEMVELFKNKAIPNPTEGASDETSDGLLGNNSSNGQDFKL